MTTHGQDTLRCRRSLDIDGTRYDYYSLEAAQAAGLGDIDRLPYSLKVLLENLLRLGASRCVTIASEDISWDSHQDNDTNQSGLFG